MHDDVCSIIAFFGCNDGITGVVAIPHPKPHAALLTYTSMTVRPEPHGCFNLVRRDFSLSLIRVIFHVDQAFNSLHPSDVQWNADCELNLVAISKFTMG